MRGRSLGTYRSGPLLSGTDTLALYWAWDGQGPGPFEHTDVNQVRRPFRDKARLLAGPTRVSGGRAQEGPSRTWATEEEVGKKVNSKIKNKGEGRGKGGEEGYIFNIQALHWSNVTSFCFLSEI